MSTCDPNRGCPPSVPNVHCAYPKCAHGEAKNPAPVSATEPDAVRMLREGMRGQHALFNVNQEYVCAVAPLLEYIDALTARLAEAERVTEATRDTVREEFKQILCDDTSSYPRIIYPSNDVCDEIVRLRAALTAARGGG